ncbi:DUF2339 domain-containing protein [Candidatus Nomurabacteria bacterium]|nr:DUF2339 domain-containing protein [Candidatus Kaiserbacteria bacterium]MCB9814716.1 DUF2339 domain-containing protein [Candidatus Nomurabacteria bacterium]
MELLFIVVIILIVYTFSVSGKVNKLEDRINRLESRGVGMDVLQTPQTSVHQGVDEGQLAPVPQASDRGSAYEYTPNGLSYARVERSFSEHNPFSERKPNAFWEWLKEDSFVKLGAFLLLIAIGWFVSYAFMNNWIGPAGRIFMGLSLGVVLLVMGVWRIQTHGHQGGIFTAVGATTIMMTLFAARELYDFFTPVSALFVMFMTVVFVAFVSVRYQRQALALAGLVLASIAPLFTSVQQLEISVLFTYLLVVILGSLWVVAVTGWSRLIPVSLFISFMYSLPSFAGQLSEGDRDVAVIFSFIFVSIFFIANIISILRRVDTEHMHNHSTTALGSAIFLFIWIQTAVSNELQSLLYVAWALVFSVGTYLVHYYSYNRTAFFLYGGTSVALLAAATAAELSGPALTIAFLFEISAIVIASAALHAERSLVTRLCWLYVVPVAMSLESAGSSKWFSGIWHWDFFVVTLTIITLLLVGVLIHTEVNKSEDEPQNKTGKYMIVIGLVYLTVWVWLVLHALFNDESGTTLSLIAYTIAGISLYVQGKREDNKTYLIGGRCLIAFVVFWLFINVMSMDIVGRIITFCIVGVLLMSTAFIRKNNKNEIESVNNQES